MEIRFDDKIVLVTGASTGIGAAIARGFAAAGAKVVVHYNRSEAEAQKVADDLRAAGSEILLIKADVTDNAAIKSLVKETVSHFGRIDVLVNNAGALVQRIPIDEAPDALYEQIMNVNMTSTFQMCKQVIPIMKKQGGGNIINLTSISARNGGGGGSVLYASSKGAVSTFTRGLARELAGQNIRVNALSPGLILTPFHERWTPLNVQENIIKTIPMGRAGTAEECVGAALFLASDRLSGYITGQIIEINGGMLTP